MELYELLERVVQTLERLRIPYLVTGSVASMAYGEPRLTNDIDLVAGVTDRACCWGYWPHSPPMRSI